MAVMIFSFLGIDILNIVNISLSEGIFSSVIQTSSRKASSKKTNSIY